MIGFFEIIFDFWSNCLLLFGLEELWLPLEDTIFINLWTYDFGERYYFYNNAHITVYDILVWLLTFLTFILIIYMLYRIIKLIICRIANV